MFAIVSRTHDRAKKVQLKLLASCAMATSMLSANVAHAGTELPPPLTGADTAFQGLAAVASGQAHIVQTPTLDTITVSTANTVINFTPFDTANGGGPISFLPSGRTGLFVNDPNSGVTNFTVLNRIVPTDATRAIRFDGTVQSRIADAMGGSTPGGTILFYSPGGIIASATSLFDVGSLVLSAADINMGMGGTLNFNGATPGTAVDINAGASILAQGVGSYVALVAPRVIQSGSVKSDGSVAYVGAEAVDVTIQNNLFDISFVQGTDGGTAVAHTGSTEFTRAANDTSPQRIYVASVAKNDAITSLVSGSLGYTAATDVSLQNGAIILSSGRNVSETGYGGVVFSDAGTSVAPANLTIGADSSTVFNASLLTNATGDALIAPAAGTSITFNNDVNLNADRLAEVRAVAGSSTTFDANLTVSSNNLLEGAAAKVVALGDAGNVLPAGVISVGGALTVDGGDGATSTAELKADLGRVLVTGSTSLFANTDKSIGLNANADASGGTATVQVGALGSQLMLSALTLDASAKAGIALDSNETPVPGNAVGGTSQIMLGGGTIGATTVTLQSNATAVPGGSATGGTAAFLASGGTTHSGTISLNAGAAVLDSAPDATNPTRSPLKSTSINEMATANVTGGNIQLNVVNTTMNVDGDLLLHADATGQTGLGGLMGGTVSINVDNGSLLVGDSINVSANADESASTMGVTPALVKGGVVTTSSINNGDILASAMNFDANASSGGDTTGGQVTLQTMTGGSIRSIGTIGLGAAATTRSLESGGNAIGGQLLVNITSGQLISGPLVLDASAVGGDAVMSGIGGSATGGTATVNFSGGDSVVEVVSLTTDATGGKGGLAAESNLAGGSGGTALSGNGEINISGGSLRTAGFAITSSAVGGAGGDGSAGGNGASAMGGRAAVLTSEAANLVLIKRPIDPNPVPFTSSVTSSATGGAGGFGMTGTGGTGGSANGGTTILSLAGAEYLSNSTPFAVSVAADSSAIGGMGGGSGVGQAGSGGLGTGGNATITLTNNLVDFGDVTAEAAGLGGQGGNAGAGYGMPFIGGAGGNGNGGTAAINLAAPTPSMMATNVGTLAAIADATGGTGGSGNIAGVGGSATNSGSASITGTSGSFVASSVSVSANGLASTGVSASAGTTSVSIGQSVSLSTMTLSATANAEAGTGSAQGGTVNFLTTGGMLSSSNTMLAANGSSSVMGTEVGGRGGTVDVRATTAMAGPTASLSLGTTNITANGLSTPSGGMGSPANALAGRINLSSIGSETTSVSFSSLSAATTGQTSGMMAPNGGIFLTTDQGSIAVTGAATITSDESVDVTATGTGKLFVGNDLIVNARNLISVAHAGRAMGANTLVAATATFNSGGNFSAMAGTSLRADTDLSITSTMGSVTANDLSAGDDLTINAGSGVTLNGIARSTGLPMMGESSDISIVAPGAVSVNMIDASGNFSVSADSFTANGLISAGEDVSLSTAGAITTQTISVGDDVMATSVGGNISVTSAIARGTGPDNDMRGADVRLESTNGALSLNSAMSHDDIFLTSQGNITASNLTASGTGGLGNRKGIIVDSASAVMLTDISSDNSIAVRGASVTAIQLNAGEDIALLASNGLSATTATAGDDFMASSVAGNATLSGITTNDTGPDDRTADFGYGGIGFVATAADGSRIDATATTNDIVLASLSSAGATSLTAGGSVTGGTASAGGLLSLTATSVDVDSLTSTGAGSDVTVNADLIDVTTVSAGRDALFTTTAAPTSMITLGTVNANRDIMISGGTAGITAMSLSAGDDISLLSPGTANITNATTTGANMGYGGDTSDINLDANQLILGSIQAKNNLTLTSATSLSANQLTTTMGNISATAVTTANVTQAMANGGSASVSADIVTLPNITASTNVTVTHGATATLGTVMAGDAISVSGTGNSSFTSLNSTGATSLSAGGSVTGGTASAGGLLTVNASSVTATNLTSRNDSVMVTAGSSTVTTGSAAVDLVISTGMAPSGSITLTNGMAGRDVKLLSTGSVTATDATAGGDIEFNAGSAISSTGTLRTTGLGRGVSDSDIDLTAGSTINLQSVDAFTDISVLTAPGGTMIASGLAGDDINFNVTGNVNAGLLRTTGAQANGTDSDIMVTSTGMVTVNVANAFSDFESSAASFSGNNLTAGEDIEISTQGAASVMSALSGDDTIITSASGPITLGNANANGTGPDDEEGGSDVRLTATTGMISVGSATAGDEIDLTAGGSISATSLTAAGINPDDDRSNVMIDSGAGVTLGTVDADATIAIRAASVTATSLTAGEDVAIQTTGSATVTNASAGDDFIISSQTGNVTLGTVATLGNGLDDRTVDFGYGGIDFLATAADGSNVNASAGYGDLNLGIITAATDIIGSALSISSTPTSLLTAGRDLSLTAQNQISLKNAMAARDLAVTSMSGDITTLGLTAGDDINVSAPGTVSIGSALTTGFVGGMGPDTNDITVSGGSVSIGSATAKDNLSITAVNSVNYSTLTSTGSMTISAGTDVIGGSATAGGLLSITADNVDVNSLTSSTNDVVINARVIDAMTVSAGRDALISTVTMPNSMITLGTATAARDIMISGGTNGIIATDLTAGDDINVNASGSFTSTGTLRTTGLSRSGTDSDIGVIVGSSASLASLDAFTDISITGAPAGLTVIGAVAGDDIVFSVDGNITSSGLLRTTGTQANGSESDIELTTPGSVSVNVVDAFSDFEASASSFLGNNLTAGEDVELSTTGSATAMSILSGDDTVITSAMGNITLGNANANGTGPDDELGGSDVRLTATTGMISVGSATAGDEIDLTAGGSISATSLTAAGINPDDDRSNVMIDSGAGVTLGTVDADATIAIRAASVTATSLTAGEDVAIQTTGSATVTNASAGDDFIISSQTGNVTLGTVATLGNGLDDRTVDFGYGGIDFLATSADGSNVNASAGYGDLNLGIITATTDIIGSALSISSTPTSLLTAGRDLSLTAQNQISLKNAMAARDLAVTSMSGGITALGLTAGDDIDLLGAGTVSVTNALTTGSANSGYGSDPSNFTLDAAQAVVGTARARDNVTVTTSGQLDATNLLADRGSITVTTGTTANLTNVAATIGSVAITVESLDAGSISAGIDVDVEFVSNASFGSVTAGRDASIIGMGDADAGSISATRDLTTMVGGDVSITSGSAGRNLRNSSTNFTASSLMAGSDIVVLTDEAADLGSATATGRIVTNAGSSIAFANLDSGLSTSLVAGTSITGGDADAGTTLSFNANGGGVAFGTLSSGGNTTVTAQAEIVGTSASAGGALTIDSSAVGVTATSLTAGANSNLTVTASNGGNATIGSANAGRDVSVNATNVSVTTGTATRDIIYAGAQMVNAGSTTAGRDIRFTAGSDLVSDIATAAGMITASSAGNSQLNSATADNIFVVASGDTTIGSANAGTFIGINTNDVVATTLVAGEDIRLIASGTANVTNAQAGDDFDVNASAGATLGSIVASATARDDRSLDFNAPNFVIVNSASDGSDVRIVSNGAVTAVSLTAGDDITVNTGNFTLSGTATTRGLGNIDSGSNVLINAAATSVATVNAADDIVNNSVSFAGAMLNSNRSITITTSEDSSLGTANAVQGPISANSTRGLVSFVDLSTSGNIVLNTGGRISGGDAQAGGLVDLNGANGVTFDSIDSGSDTFITGGSVVGGTIDSLASVFVDGDVIDLNSVMSDFGSILLSGRDVSVDTAGARFDFVVSPGKRSAGDRIALGNVVVGRDIVLTGARDTLTATSLMAGDDIDIDIIGNAKIGLAITDGSFGSGYGDGGYGDDGYGDVTRPTILRAVDGGYGPDLSNITLDAAQSMIGTARAHDNVTLTTSSGTMAGTVVADNGDILINGGTSAIVTSASATMGNVTINANSVDVGAINAGIDVAVNFGSEASLGTVTAGDQIDIVGTGDLDFDSLTSANATTITTNGAVTGGTSLAGGLLSLTAGSIDVDRLTSSGSSIQASAANVIIDNSSALIDLNVDTKNLSGSRISLGTASAGRDIKLTGGTLGISANSLTAGDDIMVAGSGTVTIDNALTTGVANSGYGDSGYGNGTSDIMVDAVKAIIGTAKARDNVTLMTSNQTMAGSVLADNGNILINGGTSAIVTSASAPMGNVTINANSVDVGAINAGIDVAVNFGSEASLGTVTAGDQIDIVGTGDLDFDSLTSANATTITTNGAVTGGTSLAGGLLSLTAGSIDVDRLTSSGSSIQASAANVIIDNSSALIDLNVDTKNLSGSRISLGTASAGRDLKLTGGTLGILADSLTAGDDIMVAGSGTVSIGNALTTGVANSGYGDSGYGNGTSDILVDATQIVVGTARAKDNIALTSSGSSAATTLTADRGAITIDSETSAMVGSATATLGSVAISADSAVIDNIAAGTTARVTFGTESTLGAVIAGTDITLTGDGDLEYDSLRSGSATSISADGNVVGGSASAGTSFTATTGGSFSASRTTEAMGLVNISGGSLNVADVTSGTTTSLAATRAITAGNVNSGTGLNIRGGTMVTTGSLTARSNDVTVVANSGMAIGSATATTGSISLTNVSGAVATGNLNAGNDATVSNGGTINISAVTASDDVRIVGGAGVTVGTASTAGGADGDNDGNDIVIAAMGPLSITTATTQRGALASSDINLTSAMGSANVSNAAALGNLSVAAATSLTAGTASAGANLTLTGQSVNATALTAARNLSSTSSGATNIADARATGGNLTVTAAGALTLTNGGALGDVRLTSTAGGNISTGTLSSGSAFTGATTGGMPGPGDIMVMSDGNVAMSGNSSAGRNLGVTAKNQISVSGVSNGVGIDLKSTDIVINSQTGRIGEQGRTTQIQLTNTSSGTTTIGGAGVTGSYSLANAEAQRLFAGDIIITATGTGDTIVDALTLTGATGQTGATGGNIGASGRLRIETPGKLRTIGAATISGLSTANRFQVSASQGIEVDAATGSISLTGAAGAPGGMLELTAPTIVAASQAATTEIAALTDGRAINDRLAINDGAISDAGNFTADSIVVNVSNGFFVQNSGIKELSAFSFGDRRGISVGAGGLTINAASATTRIFVSGRQLLANGSFLTGVDFLRRQSINGTQVQLSIFPPTPFDPASTVNGCAIINSASCLINIDGGSLARDVVGQSDEDSGGSGGNGSSSDANFVQFQFKNLDEANFQAVIDDPVTGVGNDDLWALYDAKACADDQSLEGCSSPK